MKSKIIFGLLIAIFSCSGNEDFIDPLNGAIDVFKYEDKLYNTTGGAYFLYDKVDGRFNYCFLIGTSGNYVFPKNINESYVDRGNFVRIFLQADTLGKTSGTYEITSNENNVVSISGKSDPITSGEIALTTGLNEAQFIEIEATTESGKKLNLRAQLTTWSVAYKIVRTVEGGFNFNLNSYDISQAFSSYDTTDSQLTLVLQDDNEEVASQIVFFISKADNLIPGLYLGTLNATDNCFTGYVSLKNIVEDSHILQTNFNDGSLEVKRVDDLYEITFDFKTISGHTFTGHYLGAVLE